MRRMESWMVSLLWVAVAIGLPIAALEPVSIASATSPAPALALGACDDGSAHLAMGCSRTSL